MINEDAIKEGDFPTELVTLSSVILTVSNHIGEETCGLISDPCIATGWHSILYDVANDLNLISKALEDDKKKGGKK